MAKPSRYGKGQSAAKSKQPATKQAPAPPKASANKLAETTNLEPLVSKCEEARSRDEAQLKLIKKAEEDAAAERRAYEAKAEKLESDTQQSVAERERLGRDKAELQQQRDSLTEWEQALNLRHEHILKREADAEAGFLQRNRELLASLDVQLKLVRETTEQERTQALANLRAELKALKEQEEARLSAERDSLEAERIKLQEDRFALKSAQEELREESDSLAEEKRLLEAKVNRLAMKRNSNLASDLEFAKEQLDKLRSDRDRLEHAAKEHELFDMQFQGRKPAELLRELDTLRLDNQQLRQELASRPSEQEAARLLELEREKHEWQTQVSLLRRELHESEIRRARNHIPTVELETLRDEKAAYEASCRKLTADLDELRSDLEGRAAKGSQRLIFRACSEFDADETLQTRLETQDRVDLSALVTDARHRMVSYPKDGTKLYYSDRDVRSFIAGLAMSRLLILQGMSGTGKTSLPLAFAAAIDGGSEPIEVQAGWRDRNDLIGYFNSFDKEYYESNFLRSLYQAQCPRYDNRPYFIVLDEMNLSHPEQYFADFISVIERSDEASLKINLTSKEVSTDQLPRLLENKKAVSIRLPRNVWFIGTANHDETTKDFADKTYDRAHVMELPLSHPVFDPKKAVSSSPRYSYEGIQKAFSEAKIAYKNDAEKAKWFLKEQIKGELAEKFRVGWSNRLGRQIDAYVPVVRAAGGTLTEAMDYLIAMKLVRKVRNRYENRSVDIESFRQHVLAVWPKLDNTKLGPTHSKLVEMLDEELKRIGRASN